jgi:hypothetical protein
VPLAYNFLTFLPEPIRKTSTFYNFLGRLINLTPLGTWFDYIFPILILLPVCATLFNLYGKIKNTLGFGILSDEEDEEQNPSGFGTGGWREGRDLIARDLQGDRSTVLGLTTPYSSSPRASLDHPRASRATPTRWVPRNTLSTRDSGSTLVESGATRSSGPARLDAEGEEESFFTLFGRRVKNTLDTIDTPKWMRNESSKGFQRPKWMGGDSDNADRDGADRSNGNGTRANNNILGIFGGGSNSNDGRIVL